MADLRHDPMTGRWVAIAPERATRPGASNEASDEVADCPFCAGHEERTPPETLRLGDGPTGWAVRVVPNLYPALERQEVVIHGPVHVHSIGELSDDTIDLVAESWQRRARDNGGICFPLINEGHEAGASLAHSHSQLAWLPAPAPAAGPALALRALPPDHTSGRARVGGRRLCRRGRSGDRGSRAASGQPRLERNGLLVAKATRSVDRRTKVQALVLGLFDEHHGLHSIHV